MVKTVKQATTKVTTSISDFFKSTKGGIHRFSAWLDEKYSLFLTAADTTDNVVESPQRNLAVYFPSIFEKIFTNNFIARIAITVVNTIAGFIGIAFKKSTDTQQRKQKELDYTLKQLIKLKKEFEPDYDPALESVKKDFRALDKAYIEFIQNLDETETNKIIAKDELNASLNNSKKRRLQEAKEQLDKYDLLDLLIIQEKAQKDNKYKNDWAFLFQIQSQIDEKINDDLQMEADKLFVQRENDLKEKPAEEKPFDKTKTAFVVDTIKDVTDHYSGGGFWVAWWYVWNLHGENLNKLGSILLAVGSFFFVGVMELNRLIMKATKEKEPSQYINETSEKETSQPAPDDSQQQIQNNEQANNKLKKLKNKLIEKEFDSILTNIYMKYYFKKLSKPQEGDTVADKMPVSPVDGTIVEPKDQESLNKNSEEELPKFVVDLINDQKPRMKRKTFGTALMSGYLSAFFLSWPIAYFAGALGFSALGGPIGLVAAAVIGLVAGGLYALYLYKKTKHEHKYENALINERKDELKTINKLAKTNQSLKNKIDNNFKLVCEKIDKALITNDMKQKLKEQYKPAYPDFSFVESDFYIRRKDHQPNIVSRYFKRITSRAYIFLARFWTGSLFNRSLNAAGAVLPSVGLGIGATAFTVAGAASGVVFGGYKAYEYHKEGEHAAHLNLVENTFAVKNALELENAHLTTQLNRQTDFLVEPQTSQQSTIMTELAVKDKVNTQEKPLPSVVNQPQPGESNIVNVTFGRKRCHSLFFEKPEKRATANQTIQALDLAGLKMNV